MLKIQTEEPSSHVARAGQPDEVSFLNGRATYQDLCIRLNILAAPCARLNLYSFPYRLLRRGEVLYSVHSRLDHIYAVSSGHFKVVLPTYQKPVISGFAFSGDVIGMDGIYDGTHVCDVISLADSVVIAIPFAKFSDICTHSPMFGSQMLECMSRYLLTERQHSRVLAGANAVSKVAGFLVRTFDQTGESARVTRSLVLNTSRTEIGSYLGLTRATVSGVLASFHAKGYLNVKRRRIEILDYSSLRRIAVSNCVD